MELLQDLRAESAPRRFDCLSTEEQSELVDVCLYWCGFEKRHLRPQVLADQVKVYREIVDCLGHSMRRAVWLQGPVQSGKTSMLALLLRAQCSIWGCQMHMPAYHLPTLATKRCAIISHHQFNGLINTRDPVYGAEIYGHSFHELERIPVLIIDDVGAATEGSTGYSLSRLEELINVRWQWHAPTWFSSNADIKALKKRPGWERIVGRVMQRDWCSLFQIS